MTVPRQTVRHLEAEALTAHPGNVREDLGDLTDLALSIRQQGILEPLIATEHPVRPDVYVLLDGHRRFGAGLLVGLRRFPVIVRHDVSDPVEQTIVMLSTDVHKRHFSPLDRANAYDALRNQGLTISDIARRVGISPSVVSHYLNLTLIDEETAAQVARGEQSVGDAIAEVRVQRQAERRAQDKPVRGRPAQHFSKAHRLAPSAGRRCAGTGHTRSYGGVACGQCWEDAIIAAALAGAA